MCTSNSVPKAAHQPNSRGLLLPSSFCSTFSRLPPSHSSMTTMFCAQPSTLSATLSPVACQQRAEKRQALAWLRIRQDYGVYPSIHMHIRCKSLTTSSIQVRMHNTKCQCTKRGAAHMSNQGNNDLRCSNMHRGAATTRTHTKHKHCTKHSVNTRG